MQYYNSIDEGRQRFFAWDEKYHESPIKFSRYADFECFNQVVEKGTEAATRNSFQKNLTSN